MKPAHCGRVYFAIANYEDKSCLLTGGAAKDNTGKWRPHGSLLIYDIAEDTWSEGAAFKVARNAHSSCVVNTKLFIFGGEDDYGMLVKTIESIEMAAPEQVWEQIVVEAFTPRIYAIVSPVSDTDAVIMGGDYKKDGGWHLYADVIVYNDEVRTAERINAHAGLPIKSLSPGFLLNSGKVVALVRAPGNFLHIVQYARESNELSTLMDFGNI